MKRKKAILGIGSKSDHPDIFLKIFTHTFPLLFLSKNSSLAGSVPIGITTSQIFITRTLRKAKVRKMR